MIIKGQKIQSILIPIISVLLGFLVGAIIMLAFGFDPIWDYGSLFIGAFGNLNSFGETLRQATPLILTALGFAVANTAGFFNIGLAGQALCGWIASVAVALALPNMPGFILIPLSIIAGAVAGALWAGIAGVLRAYLGTSEVITTIMLNYTALYLSNYIVKYHMADNSNLDYTRKIPKQAMLRTDFLEKLTNYSTLHYGLLIALAMVAVVWFIMQKTSMGYEIRAVGLNEDASLYAGMSTKKTIITAMLISGALAGMGGTMEGLGNFQNIFVNTSMPAIGFDGMAVSLLAGGNPVGIIFSSFLFGVLKIGGLNIPITLKEGAKIGTPSEIVDIVIACIIFFVGASYAIKYFFNLAEKRKMSRESNKEAAS